MYPDPNGTLVGNPNKKALFHRLPQGRSCYTPSNKPWPLKMMLLEDDPCLLAWPIFHRRTVRFRDPVAPSGNYIPRAFLAQAGLVCLFGLFRMISLPENHLPKRKWPQRVDLFISVYCIYMYIYVCIYIYIPGSSKYVLKGASPNILLTKMVVWGSRCIWRY